MGPPDMPGPSSSKQPAKKAKTSASQGQDPVLVYLRPEDEFLHAAAEWSFTFPVENRVVGKDDLAPLRMVMLVDAKAVAGVRRELDSVVGNMAAGHKA
ncbi:hypothetical protein FOA52_010481 [Chlamydomonas sp. UWO 241]|nr:hypothetical protein FOA52_010481 [Chlamydomonas sp. UWO 241]